MQFKVYFESRMMSRNAVGIPAETEFVEYFGRYINRVPEGNVVAQLGPQIEELRRVGDRIDEETASVLHPPYTWTIKQVVGHLIDVERVFGYRALRFASGDLRPICGMEQDAWVENTDYETPALAALVDEFAHSRKANQLFFERLRPEAWDMRGEADGSPITVRALAYCLVGHVIHHLEIIKARVG